MKRQPQSYIAKKAFGQNFLADKNVLEKIVRAIEPNLSDVIIEVGPGRGALTKQLVEQGSRIIGVELDRDLIPVLTEQFGSASNFQLINKDILWFLPNMVEAIEKYKLAGNIPYNLTTKLFEKLLDWQPRPESITFLIQKEVGEKIIQKGGKNSPLAVCVAMLGTAKIVTNVKPQSFRPAPRVDSVVIHIDCASAKKVDDPFGLYDFAHKIFRMPRKTLWNNLLSFNSRENAQTLLTNSKISPQVRPEALSFDQIFLLYCIFLNLT